MRKTEMLACSCCGQPTRGRQHWNQDRGYGLCDECVPFVSDENSKDYIEETYGKPGVNYLLKKPGKKIPSIAYVFKFQDGTFYGVNAYKVKWIGEACLFRNDSYQATLVKMENAAVQAIKIEV